MSETSFAQIAADVPDSEQRGQPVALIGWISTLASIAMYFAYIDQISLNLNGTKGSVMQPAATFVAAGLWVTYAAWRTKRDWPLICANVPGIILAATAALTAI